MTRHRRRRRRLRCPGLRCGNGDGPHRHDGACDGLDGHRDQ